MTQEYMPPRVFTVELTYIAETVKVQVTDTTPDGAISRAKEACPAMVRVKIVDVYNVRVDK